MSALDKILKVLNSCTNVDQINICEEWIRRLKLEDFGLLQSLLKFCQKKKQDLRRVLK